MIATQKITVDLNNKTDRPAIDVVQGDGARAVEVSLYSGSEVWKVPAGVLAHIRYQNADGTGGCYDSLADNSPACSISGNTVTVLLAPETMTVSGVTQLQVVLRSGDAALAAFTVNMTVEPDYSLGTLEADDYVNLSVWIRDETDRRMAQACAAGSYTWGTADDLHQRFEPDFSMGSLDDDGQEIDANNHIRTGYIRSAGRRMAVVFPEGVKVRRFYYDAEYNFLNATGYFESSFNSRSDACFVRCVAAYMDEMPVTDVSALGDKVAIFFTSDSHDAFRGNVLNLRTTSFERCYDDGYYQFTTADLEKITDAPPISCGGILEVRTCSGDGMIFQTITTADGQLWFRYDDQPFQRILPQDTAEILLAKVTAADGVYSLVDTSHGELLEAIEAGVDVRLILDFNHANTERCYRYTSTGITPAGSVLMFSCTEQNTLYEIVLYPSGMIELRQFAMVSGNRRINGHVLSADVKLTAGDVGAAPDLRQIGQKIASGEISRIILLGDSITDGYGGTGYNGSAANQKSTNTAGYCWANALKKYLSGRFGTTVENYGYFGSNAAQQVAAIENVLTEDDFVIWLSGTNNRINASVFADYETNLAGYISAIQSKAAGLLFMSCLPATEIEESCSYKTSLDINRVIAKVIPDGTMYLDLYSEYVALCRENGIRVDDTMYDYGHPNDTGYHLMLMILCRDIGLPLWAHIDYSQTGDWWNGWELLINTGLDARRTVYPFSSWDENTVPCAMFCHPNKADITTRFTGQTLRKIVFGGTGFVSGTLTVGSLELNTIGVSAPVLENPVVVEVGTDGVVDFGEGGYTIPEGHTLGIGAVSDTARLCYTYDSYVGSSNWILLADGWAANALSGIGMCAAFYKKS